MLSYGNINPEDFLKTSQPAPLAIRATLRHYLRASLKYRPSFYVILFSPLLAILFGNIGFSYYLARMLEQLANLDSVSTSAIWGTFKFLLLLLALEILFWRINDYTYLYRQAKILRDLEHKGMQKLQAHSFRFFADNFTGSLVTQFNRFLKSYETLEDLIYFEIIQSLAMLLFSTIVLLFIAPPLGVALFVWAIIFASTMMWLTIRKAPLTRAAAEADSNVTAHVADVITNILTVKVFGRHDAENKAFANTTLNRFTRRRASWNYDLKIRNIRWAFMAIFLMAYIGYSAHMVITGQVGMTVVLAAQLYIFNIVDRLFNIAKTIERASVAFADASEMTAILDQELDVNDPEKPEPLRINKGDIVFDHMNFRYTDGKREIFKDFTLHIPASQKVGLVEHSGSGKSTLTRLLLRFSDIQAGSITIDGQNISNIKQDDLRSHIAFVPQEPILFHRSLLDNIRYGRTDATDKEVHAAARMANAADFIERMPEQYDTLVGERGVKLSGGEKQRVAIARAMLSRAPILVLDEATSALDSRSEKLITEALDRLMKDRTTIVIAHRLSTIRKLNRILVMKDGTIIEDGSHESLLEQKGEYAELWKHQSGGFLEE